MIRINQIKVMPKHTQEDILKKAARILRIAPDKIQEMQIVKKSIDARKKPDIYIVYTVDVKTASQDKILSACRGKAGQVQAVVKKEYQFPALGTKPLNHRPIIVGTGPAGLFCGYMLARQGYRPILLERGREAGQRLQDVERFWKEGVLMPDSNVQFGEGGAGTFSDGKLNTLVKDPFGRNREVLEILVQAGAPADILYEAKPHIGTDILMDVVAHLRRQILAWGGEVHFETKVTDLLTAQNRVTGIRTEDGRLMESDVVILAIGHSARDTFYMLKERQIPMEAKAFAVGLRMEHPSRLIDDIQYGGSRQANLPAANYKVTAKTKDGRGVYSFCMCPGGYVVNASSEPGRTAINGMSYSGRNGTNSNSAMIVTVTPKDYGGSGPLAGIDFQRRLEEQAYRLGAGTVPQQLFGDFERRTASSSYGGFSSAIKGQRDFGNLHQLFSGEIHDSFCRGMHQFSRYIPGFDRPDTILSGVESRTSSPVRILRDENFESNKKGVYPCGEGAGYAGGIMSAAMDGMKIAEAIAKQYKGK